MAGLGVYVAQADRTVVTRGLDLVSQLAAS